MLIGGSVIRKNGIMSSQPCAITYQAYSKTTLENMFCSIFLLLPSPTIWVIWLCVCVVYKLYRIVYRSGLLVRCNTGSNIYKDITLRNLRIRIFSFSKTYILFLWVEIRKNTFSTISHFHTTLLYYWARWALAQS